MAHIYVFSPSSAVRDKAAFRRGVARLKALGHEVEVDAAALSAYQRFAGDDESRLAAITRASASGADIAIISRGGYGLTRLLPQLPYKAMAKAVAQGTQFVGFSDFSAFQASLYARHSAPTWSGPDVVADWGREEVDDIMQDTFQDLTLGQNEGAGWRLPVRDTRAVTHRPDGFWAKKATLWGGNLSVLTSLIGTPYFPEIRGGILYLEDLAEHPYRIERMLTQWLHAGILAHQKAIVLGAFTHYALVSHDAGFQINTVVDRLRQHIKVPVLTGLPFGHVATKVCLPFGAQAQLMVQGRDALLLWTDG
jgi:muramoyltetrapeptide carboxypeptidase